MRPPRATIAASLPLGLLLAARALPPAQAAIVAPPPVPKESSFMSMQLPPEMLAATHLTRQGRLAEATALIQRLLSRGQAPHAAPPMPETAAAPQALQAALPAPSAEGASPASAAQPASIGLRARHGLGETLRRLRGLRQPIAAPGGAPDAKAPALPLPDGARFVDGTFVSAAGQRSYKLYIPSDLGATPRPLVVMLHGCTQSPEDFAAGTGMNRVAEEERVFVVYPAQPAAANPHKCWNWFNAADQQRDRGEPALIAGITRQVMAEHAVDPTRVYVAGLSAGGAAASVMATAYPDLYAAAGVHSGLPAGAARDVPSAFAAMRQGSAGAKAERPTPTIVFHGDQDQTVHPRNGEAVASQSLGAVGSLTPKLEQGERGGRKFSRRLHEDAAGRVLVEHWTIHGAGHAWTGGDTAGSYADPQGPDASREMLRFFHQHQLGGGQRR